MTVVNKIKQLIEVDISKLVLLAKAEECKTNHDIAKWIIAHSPYWRNQGYQKIIDEIGKDV